MKRVAILLCLIFLCTTNFSCAPMTPTGQGLASGAALGALGGAGISAMTGGDVNWGALVGGATGALAGGIIGSSSEEYRNQNYYRSGDKYRQPPRREYRHQPPPRPPHHRY